jgi:hypothetical protein
MQYSFAVANGSYQANLYFAETCSTLQFAGARVFDVQMQGAVVFSALDIFATAGGYTALEKSASVTVTNGTLTIGFPNHVNAPILSAIEILPLSGTGPAPISVSLAPASATVLVAQSQPFAATVLNDSLNKGVNWSLSGTGCSGVTCGTLTTVTTTSVIYTAPASVPAPAAVSLTATSVTDNTKTASTTVTVSLQKPIRVNVGGPSYTDSLGQVWSADSGFNLGNVSGCAPTATVTGTPDPALFKSARYGLPPAVMQYSFAVANGSYQANLYFAETCSTLQFAGARVFDVQMQGAVVFSALDIFATAGGYTALEKSASVTVTNGTLTIGFPNHVNAPILSAIEILPLSGTGPAPISVSLAPASATVLVAQSQPFAATVLNDSLNKGVNWSLSGAGCAGAACGTVSASSSASGIAIRYTAPAGVPVPTTLTLTARSITDNTRAAAATITVAAASGIVSVALSPKRGGLTLSQALILTAVVTNDVGGAGVTWSSTAGSFSTQNNTSATFVAPNSAGTVSVTATSATDGSKNASITLGITDLIGVITYHNDLSRDGVNAQEYALTTSNVNTTSFGKLYSCALDAAAYAQPLWVAHLVIGGGPRNVVFAATSRDSVYAFDADAKPCVTYWQKPLLAAGETWLASSDSGTSDITPEIGIVGTPVIDAATQTLYVVSKSKNTGSTCAPSSSCHQRLHALNLADGAEKMNGPVDITSAIFVAGTGDGTSGGTVAFNTLTQNQRPGLALVNGVVYITWASHGDRDPYHGWVVGYSAGNLAQAPVVFNDSPNGSRSGIWMSGGAPAADNSNNLYLITGNGTYDGKTKSDYGDTFLKLSTVGGVSVADWFTPADQSSLEGGDTDFGSGGAAILVDQPSSPVPHLVIGGGKEGNLFLLNRDKMGAYNSPNQVVQTLAFGQAIFATGAFWNNSIYLAGVSGHLKTYSFNTTMGIFNTASLPQSPTTYGFPGATPAVSSSGTANGIVWAIDSSAYGAPGPAILHAYDATNLASELWNSSQAAANRDTAGNAVKFTVPTIANGRVYVGTRSEITVFGLLP